MVSVEANGDCLRYLGLGRWYMWMDVGGGNGGEEVKGVNRSGHGDGWRVCIYVLCVWDEVVCVDLTW